MAAHEEQDERVVAVVPGGVGRGREPVGRQEPLGNEVLPLPSRLFVPQDVGEPP
jgi:hypothetical protein